MNRRTGGPTRVLNEDIFIRICKRQAKQAKQASSKMDDFDDADLFSTNRYIPTRVEGVDTGPSDTQFREYIKSKRNGRDAVSLISFPRQITSTNTNITDVPVHESVRVDDIGGEVRKTYTYINVDSRDRDVSVYTKANHFKVFLGTGFNNVSRIRLTSLEFPNTNAVVNSSNNRIYWRNQSDVNECVIDNITRAYPIYSVALRIGSYTASTLVTEMNSKLNLIKRDANVGDYHYFISSIDLDTDIVSYTSLILTQLENNCISVVTGLGIITVAAGSHGYTSGETVYILGATTTGGVSANVLNGPHTITVINSNTFQFEVNIKAGGTVVGGGNTIQSGKLAPFQLMFGDYSDGIGGLLGFPTQNSSQLIKTFVKSISNTFLVSVTLSSVHGLTNSTFVVNQSCVVSGTGSVVDGTRAIMWVSGTTTLLISSNSRLTSEYDSGLFSFGGKTWGITKLVNYATQTLLVETFTPHGYVLSDLPSKVTFADTITTPSYNDGAGNDVLTIPTDKTLIIPGYVLSGGSESVSTPIGGYIPTYKCLTTKTLVLTNAEAGIVTKFTSPDHGLVVGDYVTFYNVMCTPSLQAGYYLVYTVPDSDTFTILFATSNVAKQTVLNGQASVGTRIVTVNFPYHGYNCITSIVGVGGGVVECNTLLPHNLVDDQIILLSQTNCVPSLDSTDPYTVTVIDSDTFRVTSVHGSITTSGTFGIIGIDSNKFNLYGVTSVGGIPEANLNNKPFTIREILSEHSFSFTTDHFASSTESGGGNNVYVSDLIHGFSGTQDNTLNSQLNRSVNLAGENYAFLCSPQLNTMSNTGSVKDVFARIQLDRPPGTMVFSFLSHPKEPNTTDDSQIFDLEFSVVSHDNTLYEFNDMDYSFVLEIEQTYDSLPVQNPNRRGPEPSNPESAIRRSGFEDSASTLSELSAPRTK